MIITAHGGALNTGRNTHKYFETVANYEVDAIEVDIYKRNDILYISHLPKLFYKKAITLSYVFDYLKKNNFKINCDVKWKGLVKPVLELAEEKGVSDRIYFTGYVSKEDLRYLSAGEVYLNAGFFKSLKPKTENLEAIKNIIDNLNNDKVKGINVNYRYCTEEFLAKAKEIGLAISVFTVDNKEELKRLIQHKELANITTNIIDVAIEYNESL